MTDDWSDALAELIRAGARFIIVGAHALAVHGVLRATQDLDIWVDPTPEMRTRCGLVSQRSGRLSKS